jgi:hypothetical protein
MHSAFECEGLGLVDLEAIAAAVDGEPEAIGLRRVGESQFADLRREELGVCFLQAENVWVTRGDEVGKFVTRRVLAEVVADDSDFSPNVAVPPPHLITILWAGVPLGGTARAVHCIDNVL